MTTFPPFSLVYYWYNGPIKPLVFFWVNIGQGTLFSISHYSDSESWQPQKTRKMNFTPIFYRMDIISQYILVFFSVYILVNLHKFIFRITQVQILGDNRISDKWFYLH